MARPKNTGCTPSWDLLPQSTNLLRVQFVPALYLLILPGLLVTLGQLLLRGLQVQNGQIQLDNLQTAGIIVMTVGALWTLINLGPAVYFQLQATKRDEVLSLGACYRAGLRYSLRMVVLYLVSGVLVLLGLLLLIVPGVLLIRRFFLAQFYLMTDDLKVRDALRASSHDSKAAAKPIWGTLGVISVVALAAGLLSGFGIIGLLVGTLASYITVFLPALRYREIHR